MLLPQFCGKWDVSYPECANFTGIEAELRFRCQVLNILMRDWKKEEGAKVLIFTKSVKLLDMLDYHLNSHGVS